MPHKCDHQDIVLLINFSKCSMSNVIGYCHNINANQGLDLGLDFTAVQVIREKYKCAIYLKAVRSNDEIKNLLIGKER